jgi:hypothetical protein
LEIASALRGGGVASADFGAHVNVAALRFSNVRIPRERLLQILSDIVAQRFERRAHNDLRFRFGSSRSHSHGETIELSEGEETRASGFKNRIPSEAEINERAEVRPDLNLQANPENLRFQLEIRIVCSNQRRDRRNEIESSS